MDFVGILVSFGYVFLILFLGRYVERYGKEYGRKFVHILVSNWWFIGMAFFTLPWMAAIPPASFVILNYLSYRKNLFKAMERGKGREDLGTVYYAVSLLILSLLTLGADTRLALVGGAGILTMGYGDGLAAVTGSLVRGKTIPGTKKTWAGTGTMFLASLTVLVLLTLAGGFHYALPVSLGLALAAALVELYTPLGLDNLTVPLITSGLLALLSTL